MAADPPEGWDEIDGALERRFQFGNFTQALGFINRVGAAAEEADHHPDVTLHDYKFVTVRWRTHSADAVTDLDHELAHRSNTLS